MKRIMQLTHREKELLFLRKKDKEKIIKEKLNY